MNETSFPVSVIIPAYNAEPFVEQAVRSIMEQTYTNLEILVTDDCSTDGTYAILQSFAAEDTRIRLFRNENNLGIVDTLNSMIDLAQGKYIARMDADDISFPERIEKQVMFMETHPDYAICGTNAWHINARGRITGLSVAPQNNDEVQVYKNFSCPFYHPSVMLRGEVLRLNKYKKEFEFAEDYELWLRILSHYKGENLNERLLYYRILGNSISRSSASKERQKELTKKLVSPDETLLNKISGNRFLCSYIQRLGGKHLMSHFVSYYIRRLFQVFYVFAESAMNQIKEKKYFDSLSHYSGNLLFVGINYDEESKTHTCKIEELEK